MIEIIKKKEPEELKEFKKERQLLNGSICKEDYNSFYRNHPTGFEKLQKALLEEQCYLCCYCMNKVNYKKNIENPKEESPVTVEHFLSREKDGQFSLSYSNLLGCCEGISGVIKHCGAAKSNKKLSRLPNPSDNKNQIRINQIIDYKLNGEITYNQSFFNNLSEIDKMEYLKDVNDVLNLNNELLLKARKRKLQIIINKFKSEKERRAKEVSKKDFLNSLGFFSFYGFVKACFLRNE